MSGAGGGAGGQPSSSAAASKDLQAQWADNYKQLGYYYQQPGQAQAQAQPPHGPPDGGPGGPNTLPPGGEGDGEHKVKMCRVE